MSFTYTKNYFDRADGIFSWHRRSLKMGDAMAALSYAHDITWDQLKEKWPVIFGPGQVGRIEQHPHTALDQIEFIEEKKTRQPKKILEIGGGRGEVAAVLTKMGIPVTSVEISDGATEWYERTGKHYFGQDFAWTPPVQQPIQQAGINVADYDTILMVESLEHIPAEAFDPVMEDIMNNFHGYFVVVNWKDYHPIAIGQFASAAEHCRLVNDELYDSWAARAKRTVYRDGAHLVLEF